MLDGAARLLQTYPIKINQRLMKRPPVFGIIIAIFIVGCASQYHQWSFSGGFREAQKSRNEFTIAFGGNGYTSGQRAIDLCVLRCAEVTLGHGFRYFALVKSNTEYDRSTAITTGGYVPIGHGNGVYFSTSQVIPKPSTANTILCFRNKPPTISDCFNAQYVFDELSRKYGVQKQIDQFPKFTLPRAILGINVEIEKVESPFPRPQQPRNATVSTGSKPKLKIGSFKEGCLAQKAGLKIGDEILAIDSTAIPDLQKFGEVESGWEIGRVVPVTVRRDSYQEMTIPVKTVFNSKLPLKQMADIKCDRPITEKDVLIFKGGTHATFAIPVASYQDWENPVESIEEVQSYLVAAAANAGVNGVLILNSSRDVRKFDSRADEGVGFMCVLLFVPKARLGLEFETGTGYETRFVIRRIQDTEADTSGLRIGDSILAINGIDLLQNADAARNDEMKWEVGQIVKVTVARDGRELTVPVKAIANFPEKSSEQN